MNQDKGAKEAVPALVIVSSCTKSLVPAPAKWAFLSQTRANMGTTHTDVETKVRAALGHSVEMGIYTLARHSL